MAVAAVTMVGTGYLNYRSAKVQAKLAHEKELWKLRRSAIEQLHGLRKSLFETAWRLSDTYQFPDEWRLTEKQITRYNTILMEPDPHKRYDRLNVLSSTFGAFPSFWYYKGRAALEAADKYQDNAAVSAQFKELARVAYDEYAYGYLRTETGIHRLVRKSPFDSNARRHTSFSYVFIYPEVDDSIQNDINPADLRIDTYRASGAGGQHINKTDSAVRITHLPTNIVVSCQNDRSQHKNRAEAMSMLKARLYELELRKRQAEQQALEDSKSDIGWGHQIRSYVLDQSRIKDLRTNHEVGNTQAVLDGDLDDFIEASLKQGV